MTAPKVSVVVVSHGRPAALARCLMGLSQLLYPDFQIVVVADLASLAAIAGWADRTVQCRFDTANISAARNIGIAAAAGDVIAFIDDDAVPEPTWLSHLAAPFADPVVAAAGGLVLGRNGITPQWPFRDIRVDGRSERVEVHGPGPLVLRGTPGRGFKTEGTNMAFRAATLRHIGGFDPAYRFYLDETDLNLRLAGLGAPTALVPEAIVHHGFAESARRRADRVPRSLSEIGASLAIFARRHGGDAAQMLAAELRIRRQGLIVHMVSGRIEPRDVDRLLATLKTGYADGLSRPLAALTPIADNAPWVAFPRVSDQGPLVLSGPWRQARHLRVQAAAAAQAGYRPSLFLFRAGWRPHRVRFDPLGFWEQSGGLYGRAERHGPRPDHRTSEARLAAEIRRVAGPRALPLP